MIKRLMPYILCAVFVPVCFGALSDSDEAADGYLTEGEYDGGGVRLESFENLTVAGGGTYRIEADDFSYVEVQYTSTPLSNSSGIYDIMLHDNSELLYLGGITEEITIGHNATAHLKGGRIDAITIYDLPNYRCEVNIYCQPGYTMNADFISGLWADGTSFYIDFVNPRPELPPAWESVNVIPEPATLALLGLGGLLIRRKK